MNGDGGTGRMQAAGDLGPDAAGGASDQDNLGLGGGFHAEKYTRGCPAASRP